MRLACGLLALSACWSETTPMVAPPIVVPPQPPHAHVVERGPYAEVVGTWTGHGFQYDNNRDWDIELSFAPVAGIGEQVGTVEYPDLQCGGVLLRRPEHDDMLVVQEKITHGTNCIDGGTFRIPRRPSGRAFAWKWYAPGTGDEQAQGNVHQ